MASEQRHVEDETDREHQTLAYCRGGSFSTNQPERRTHGGSVSDSGRDRDRMADECGVIHGGQHRGR